MATGSAGGASGGELVAMIAAFAGLALLVLVFATWLAARSRRAPPPRAPKRTFQHGRQLARRSPPTSVDEALRALGDAPVGRVTHARADGRSAEIVLERRKSQPCAQAAGYLAALFEAAWAHEAFVTHPQCAGDKGGSCHYVVRFGAAPTASGAPAAAASTRGSADGRRRWPRARSGAP